MSDTINFDTFVQLSITDVVFAIDIKWFTVSVRSALNCFTFIFEANFLFATECMSSTIDWFTGWISIIGSITDLRCFASVWITWWAVSNRLTFNWLTSVSTFLDFVSSISIWNFYAIRKAFVGGIITIAMIMGITFLFNTFVIMAIMFVWAVLGLDTFLWSTDVLLTDTFTGFAVFIIVELTGDMGGTVNLFTEVLSWVFLVNLFTEMIITAIRIVLARDEFT
jgi:hypothetical protein